MKKGFKNLLWKYPLIFTVLLMISCSKGNEQNYIRKTSFNENWSFSLNKNENDSISNNSEWKNLNLPHDWSIEGEFSKDHPAGAGGGALTGGTGWYKKKFQKKLEDTSSITKIIFDGVYRDSEVWINGTYLGNRPNGYVSFQYDLTPYLNYGEKKNEILVKVNNADQPNSRWYSGSGIYRNVWLTTTNKLHIAHWGTFITTPQVTKDSAEAELQIEIENRFTSPKEAEVTTTIYFDDKEITSRNDEIQISSEEKKEIKQSFQVEYPQLWSVENPQLYKAVTQIKLEDEIIDEYTTIFGIRDFEFDLDQGFILNGKPIKIKGVCMHHDLGPLGAAVNTRAIERQLEILKEMGVNGIRTAHNMPAPELLDLCDKMGFIVMDEAFDIWSQHKTENDYAGDWEEWHEEDLKSMILRDRNHPSVFMWSIGNEIQEQWNEKGAEIGRDLSAIVKELDTTRPVTAGMNPPIHTNDEDVTLQFEEAAEPNSLAGSGALDLIGYNYAHQTYTQHQKNFPNTPFIATETTSGLATRGYYEFPSDTTKIWPVRWDIPFDGGNPDNTISAFDQVRTPWGSLHETTWKIIKKHDYLSGFFIWTGFDYLGEPTPYGWPSRSSYFGIVDLAGFPKDVYYMYKSEWTDEDVLHLLPHWNWKEGQTVDVWTYYNNADEVELFLNEESLGSKSKEGDDLHVMWRLPYTAGTLKAVSRKDGKIVLEKEINTAGEPANLRLEADRETIKADGNDLVFVSVFINDEDGNLAPRAENLVNFEVSENAEIVGVASGDPTNHESFKGTKHKALNGKCLVVVKAGKEAGTVILTAKSEGLEEASIKITLE